MSPVLALAAIGLLVPYASQRGTTQDHRLLGAAVALAICGMALGWLVPDMGGIVLMAGLFCAIGLFLRHRRQSLASTQRALAIALFVMPALIAMLAGADYDLGFFWLALGGAAGAAWASAFPRYRVGLGAIMIVLSRLLPTLIVQSDVQLSFLGLVSWALLYAGVFAAVTGVVEVLKQGGPPARKRPAKGATIHRIH